MADRVALFEQWVAEFKPLLRHTVRWAGFSHIVKDQLGRERPVIVETGTLREPGNWEGDGCSTAIWDWIVGKHGGIAYSMDSNPEAYWVAARECPNVRVRCVDSVAYIRMMPTATMPPTLLYLDSYDYTKGNELNAAMHQVAELAAIWERLPSGCLIASDDNAGPGKGKAALLRGLLEMLHMVPEVDSHIVVWRKP